MTFSNELTSRDEGLHAELRRAQHCIRRRGRNRAQWFLLRDLWLKFACLVYNMSQNKLPDAVVHDIVRGAVIAERHTEVRIQCYQAATAAFGA